MTPVPDLTDSSIASFDCVPMAKLTTESFLNLVRQSGLVEKDQLKRVLEEEQNESAEDDSPSMIAQSLVKRELLTQWQADKLLQGKHKGFSLGKYRLKRLLGKGGMSSVYLAEHLLMRRECAIKVLPIRRVKDSSYLARFHREAQAVASLDHPNIVRAYDIDHEVEGDREIHFLVMEAVNGDNLQDIVKQRGPLSFEDAANFFRQAARGLEHAHQNGIVHRDVKPGNLLVDQAGVVKVLDLGLARFSEVTEENPLTVAHDEKVLGTADYLSPEQALDSHLVDSRADIYSLGCSIYYALTGHPPFIDGTLTQRLMWHQTKDPPPVSDDRPELKDTRGQALVVILEKMMAKKPDERFQTMGEVSDALAGWLIKFANAQWRTAHEKEFDGSGSGLMNKIKPATAVPVAKAVPVASVAATVQPTSESIAAPQDQGMNQSNTPHDSGFDFLASEPGVAGASVPQTSVPAPPAAPVVESAAVAVPVPATPAPIPAVAVPAAPVAAPAAPVAAPAAPVAAPAAPAAVPAVPVAAPAAPVQPALTAPAMDFGFGSAPSDGPMDFGFSPPVGNAAPVFDAPVPMTAPFAPETVVAPVVEPVVAPVVEPVAVNPIAAAAPAVSVEAVGVPAAPVDSSTEMESQQVKTEDEIEGVLPASEADAPLLGVPAEVPAADSAVPLAPAAPLAAEIAAPAAPLDFGFGQPVVPEVPLFPGSPAAAEQFPVFSPETAPAVVVAAPVFTEPVVAQPAAPVEAATPVLPAAAPMVAPEVSSPVSPGAAPLFDSAPVVPQFDAAPVAPQFDGRPASLAPSAAPAPAAPLFEARAVAIAPQFTPAPETVAAPPAAPQFEVAPAVVAPQPVPNPVGAAPVAPVLDVASAAPQFAPAPQFGAPQFSAQQPAAPQFGAAPGGVAPTASATPARKKKKSATPLIVGAIVALLAIGVGGYFVFSGGDGDGSGQKSASNKKKSSSKSGSGSSKNSSGAASPAGDSGGGGSKVLGTTIKVGSVGDLSSINDALNYIKKNKDRYDRSPRRINVVIEVTSQETFTESIVIDNSKGDYPTGIRIATKPDLRASLKPSGSGPAIRLISAEHIEIEGLDIDASGRDVAIEIGGDATRSKLQKLNVTGHRNTGILLHGSGGHSADALLLEEIDLRPAGGGAIGLHCNGSADDAPGFFKLVNCRLIGPQKDAIYFETETRNVELRENILDTPEVGIHFAGNAAMWSSFVIVNNTFYKCSRAGVELEAMPPANVGLAGSTSFAFHRNLFAACKGPELVVLKDYDDEKFDQFLSGSGVVQNWSDRQQEADPAKGERELIHKAIVGAQQRPAKIEFGSENRNSDDFLRLKPGVPYRQIGGQKLDTKPYIGARPAM